MYTKLGLPTAKRREVAETYRKELNGVEGISFYIDMPNVRHNYSYFPIFVDEMKYGQSRDELYFKMRENYVLGRRYFYPLISEFATYKNLPSSTKSNLPTAHKVADSVICLPMHHEMANIDVLQICNLIKNNYQPHRNWN
ncbi:MAG: DegT/DnrJ/EryC1/StrS family aminotransferase [Neisseria sp.]|nr:DegT/DnrJ/EryC1/StrS family aminotransferase [Neisseria sp.]